MASFDTLLKLNEHPEWIAPRSDLRVFLGEPGAPEATKTTVEPGNAFSPGMKSFGVTWWLRFSDGMFFAPELAPLETLHWQYEAGFLPLIHCQTEVGGLAIRHSLFQDGSAEDRSEAVAARVEIANGGEHATSVQLFLALRSLGPAGGPLYNLAVTNDARGFGRGAGNMPLLKVDRAPNEIGCGTGDPSPLARQGTVPEEHVITDQAGWCFGLMRFDLRLPAGKAWHVHLDCPQQTQGNLHQELPGTAIPKPELFEQRAETHLANWRKRLGGIELEVPDQDFHNAFFAGLQHMLTATVGDQARIAPLSYPLPWLRDSVFIIRCFDLAGEHELARAATEYCARNDFFGGFGAEGDAPGQGIWALVQHYRTTHDKNWLEHIYPAIQRKCDWLFRMRRATQPIQVIVDTPVLAFTQAERASGVICMPARDGIIQGAMDHGIDYALGWVNHWALCGLREAAYAARELGHVGDMARYGAEADALHAALVQHAERDPAFFEHERTVNSLLWPTGAWQSDIERARHGFETWWQRNRERDGMYQPEPYWLYFELAQAHNALLMGKRDLAWRSLDYRLRHQDLPGLYGYREGGDGIGTENAIHGVTLINQLRGCQKFESITPHGWSQSELWLLQRATLVEEWHDGLLLFAGVPDHWLQPNARITFRNVPTWYGCLSATLQVDGAGTSAQAHVNGLAVGTTMRVHFGSRAVTCTAEGAEVTVRFDHE